MNVNKLALSTAIVSALGGLYGCSEGDEATVNITSSGGDSSSSSISLNCPTWASAKPRDSQGNDVCALPSQISTDRTLNSEIVWYLDSRVTVGNGNGEMSDTQGVLANGSAVQNVVLTIEPGTSIVANSGSFANLLITRGSRIEAAGTADAPIVFSSDDEGFEGSGEWGGLILHGYGDHNRCDGSVACNIDAEGESGFAGGFGTFNDNSGTLSYVIVTEGGYEFAPGNEINGISFVAVGSGTTVDHIQVNNNADDGVEFYGGDVNVKYMVLTGNEDDSIDWDEGFQGNIQYAIVVQTDASKGNTIEADTEGAPTPLSIPTLANITFIASGAAINHHRMKASTGGFIHNSVMTFDAADASQTQICVSVEGADTRLNENTTLVYNNIIADCTTFQIYDGDGSTPAGNLDLATIFSVPAALDSNYASGATEAQLGAAVDFSATANSVADMTFLDQTDYIGAIDPNDAGTPWFNGWILDGTL